MKKILALGILALAVGTQARAEGQALGLTVNYGSYTGDGAEGLMNYGLVYDFKLAPEMALGVYFTWGTKDPVTLMTYGAAFNYFFAEGAYAGVRLGMHRASIGDIEIGDVTIEGVSNSEFAAGADVGYDFAVSPEFSVGAKFDFDFVFSDPSSKWWDVGAVFKYNF